MNRTTWGIGLFLSLALAACGDRGLDEVQKDGPAILAPGQVATTAYCGGTSQEAVTFSVASVGTEPLTVSGVTANNGFTVMANVPETLQPGATLKIKVTPPNPVVGTDRVGTSKTGKLTISSNDPQGPVEATIAADIKGAVVAFKDAEDKALTKIDLRSADTTCPQPVTFKVANDGQRPVTIGAVTGPFTVEQVTDASSTIDPGKSLEFRVLANDTEGCVTSGNVSFAVSGGVCSTAVTFQITQLVNGSTDQCICTSGGGSGTTAR